MANNNSLSKMIGPTFKLLMKDLGSLGGPIAAAGTFLITSNRPSNGKKNLLNFRKIEI